MLPFSMHQLLQDTCDAGLVVDLLRRFDSWQMEQNQREVQL